MLHRPHGIEAHLFGVLDLGHYLPVFVVLVTLVPRLGHFDFIHQGEFHERLLGSAVAMRAASAPSAKHLTNRHGVQAALKDGIRRNAKGLLFNAFVLAWPAAIHFAHAEFTSGPIYYLALGIFFVLEGIVLFMARVKDLRSSVCARQSPARALPQPTRASNADPVSDL